MAEPGPQSRLTIPYWLTPLTVAGFCVTILVAIYFEFPDPYEFSCNRFGGWSMVYVGIALIYTLHFFTRYIRIRRLDMVDLLAVLCISPVLLTLVVSRHFQCGEELGYSLALNQSVIVFTIEQSLRGLLLGFEVVLPSLSSIDAETLPLLAKLIVGVHRMAFLALVIIGCARGFSILRQRISSLRPHQAQKSDTE